MKIIKLLTILVVITLLISCESHKNNKEISAAMEAIELAGNSDQSELDAPFGLKFNMKRSSVDDYFKELKKKEIISNLDAKNYRFDYTYPEYGGLQASVELFFVNDLLSRIAFQIKNSTDFIEDWSKFYQRMLRERGEKTFDYYLPIEGVDKDKYDTYNIKINKNKVIIIREIKYRSILQNERVFIYNNQPISKKMSSYLTEKESSLGEKRIEQIKDSQQFLDENKDEIKKQIENDRKEAEMKKVENSSWDGSVRQVKQYIKSNLKDPNSYESIEWSSVQKQGENYVVRHKYRAKNSFGGYVIENKIFTLNSDGEIISVSSL